MTATPRINGVLSPVVTPFRTDLSPDPRRFIAHCKWLLSQDCGLAGFGTNSEANSMSAKERMGLLAAIGSAGGPHRSQGGGLAVCGTTSEANSMSAKERMGLLEAIVSAGVPTDRMMPGTGACSI